MRVFLIVLAVIAALAVIVAAVLLILRIWGKSHILDGPGMMEMVYTDVRADNLIGCEFSSKGGMGGENYVLTLTLNEDGGATLTVVDDPIIYEKNVRETYTLDASALDVARRIFEDFDVPHIGNVPVSTYEVLDAPNVSVRFWSSEDSVGFETPGYDYPQNFSGIFYALRDALEGLIEN